MVNLNLILAILAFVGVSAHVIGNILDEKSYWIVSDVYSGIVFSILGYRLFRLRKIKT